MYIYIYVYFHKSLPGPEVRAKMYILAIFVRCPAGSLSIFTARTSFSACPLRQFHTLPDILDSRAAL